MNITWASKHASCLQDGVVCITKTLATETKCDTQRMWCSHTAKLLVSQASQHGRYALPIEIFHCWFALDDVPFNRIVTHTFIAKEFTPRGQPRLPTFTIVHPQCTMLLREQAVAVQQAPEVSERYPDLDIPAGWMSDFHAASCTYPNGNSASVLPRVPAVSIRVIYMGSSRRHSGDCLCSTKNLVSNFLWFGFIQLKWLLGWNCKLLILHCWVPIFPAWSRNTSSCAVHVAKHTSVPHGTQVGLSSHLRSTSCASPQSWQGSDRHISATEAPVGPSRCTGRRHWLLLGTKSPRWWSCWAKAWSFRCTHLVRHHKHPVGRKTNTKFNPRKTLIRFSQQD